jgi:hypothetical protein
MHWGNDPFWREMVMIDGDTFFMRAEYARIRFERGADGLIHGMTWTWSGGAHLTLDPGLAQDGENQKPCRRNFTSRTLATQNLNTSFVRKGRQNLI